MSLSKYAATAIAVLMTLLCSISTVNASDLPGGSIATEVEYSKGGPRDVVQTMVDVVVFQPTEDNLYINIVNNEGEVVLCQETATTKTVISTVGLENGTYTVQTIDDSEEYQDFMIEIF